MSDNANVLAPEVIKGPQTAWEQKKMPNRLLRMCLFPTVLYFFLFVVFTYPLIGQFSTHFFADGGDGMQNVWNIWWIHKAVTQLHQSPWHTTELHYPYGVSLLGQTLNPFNGFLCLFLLPFLTLVQAHNVIVVFSFVASGVTAFWLAYYVSRSYAGSLIGGVVFTFSEYHFMHAQGHMQLISMEWLPLFVLCWCRLLDRPSLPLALGAALALGAVLLCDYYYFFYSVLLALILLAWRIGRERSARFLLTKPYLSAAVTFLLAACATCGPLILALWQLNRHDPLLGSHDPYTYSMDLLAPFIPGGHWRFASLTERYWSRLPGNIHESSAYAGLSVVCVVLYVWMQRRRFTNFGPGLWLTVTVSFALFALGPRLHIHGHEIALPHIIKMPYHVLERLIPMLSVSGVPVRMIVITTLSAAVLCAIGFGDMLRRSSLSKMAAVLLLIVMFFELLPAPLPLTSPAVPAYVARLRAVPGRDGVLDMVSGDGIALYYATVYDKPMALGYISRTPTSVDQKDQEVRRRLAEHDYHALYTRYDIRYLLMDPAHDTVHGRGLSPMYEDKEARLYDLHTAQSSRATDPSFRTENITAAGAE